MASSLAQAASEDPSRLESGISLRSVGDDAEVELVETPIIDRLKFPMIESLDQIPGNRIVPIGIGGGSDCIQASLVSDLLKSAGKDCPCVISIRAGKTGSQSATGGIGEQRTVENHGGEIKQGVYLITPETTGSGRFLENVPAGEIPVYLVIEQEGVSLTEQIDSVLAAAGSVDTVVAVDTGGDALYSTTSDDNAKATPDQDLRSLEAINGLDGVQKLSCEIAVGIDTPPDGEDILTGAEAQYYEPTSGESARILARYQEWGMDGSDESRFGKTALAWQAALADRFGFQSINLPTRVVLDKGNPWNPFVRIQPSTKGLFFMDTRQHLRSIGK